MSSLLNVRSHWLDLIVWADRVTPLRLIYRKVLPVTIFGMKTQINFWQTLWKCWVNNEPILRSLIWYAHLFMQRDGWLVMPNWILHVIGVERNLWMIPFIYFSCFTNTYNNDKTGPFFKVFLIIDFFQNLAEIYTRHIESIPNHLYTKFLAVPYRETLFFSDTLYWELSSISILLRCLWVFVYVCLEHIT